MSALVLDIARRYAGLVRAAVWPPAGGCARPGLRHYATTLPLLLLLPPWLVYHWLGLLLDELLFRRYRRVEVHEPLFVLGVPRSGTTAVHHALARDPRNTTLTTWECLFAPAITWRYLWTGVARVDRAVGRPLARLVGWLERRCLGGFQRVHPIGLETPEEDYLALLPILGCFILVVPFPDAAAIWRLGGGTRTLQPGERERLLRFHQRILQRHLYFHGAERRLLSKNAAFASLAPSLVEHYPRARVLACLREPASAVSSQLAAVEPSLYAFHGACRAAVFRNRMLEHFGAYYRDLLTGLRPLAGRAVLLPAGALRADPGGTLAAAHEQLGLTMAAEVADDLLRQARTAASAGSHGHALSDFGLDPVGLGDRFAGLHAEFDFAAAGPVPAGPSAERASWRAPA